MCNRCHDDMKVSGVSNRLVISFIKNTKSQLPVKHQNYKPMKFQYEFIYRKPNFIANVNSCIIEIWFEIKNEGEKVQWFSVVGLWKTNVIDIHVISNANWTNVTSLIFNKVFKFDSIKVKISISYSLTDVVYTLLCIEVFLQLVKSLAK